MTSILKDIDLKRKKTIHSRKRVCFNKSIIYIEPIPYDVDDDEESENDEDDDDCCMTTYYGCKLPDHLNYEDLGDQKDQCRIVLDQEDRLCIVHKDEFPLVNGRFPPKDKPLHVLKSVLKYEPKCAVLFLKHARSKRKYYTLEEFFDIKT